MSSSYQLIFIAPPATGKSTIGKIFEKIIVGTKRFNQDQFGGKPKPYYDSIQSTLDNETLQLMIIDKCNHTFKIRNELYKVLGNTSNIIYVVFYHPDDGIDKKWDILLKVCKDRIYKRGTGHETLYPNSRLDRILNSFKNNYEPLSQEEKDNAYKIIYQDATMNPLEMAEDIIQELPDLFSVEKDKISEVYNEIIIEENEKRKTIGPLKKTLYWSAVFPYPERTKLLENDIIKKVLDEHSEWSVICDHLTLLFLKGETRVKEEDLQEYEGKLIDLELTSIAWDDKIIAIKAKLEIPCENTNPHITLALSKGTSPVYSNKMLDNPTIEIVFNEPLVIRARVVRILK